MNIKWQDHINQLIDKFDPVKSRLSEAERDILEDIFVALYMKGHRDGICIALDQAAKLAEDWGETVEGLPDAIRFLERATNYTENWVMKNATNRTEN